MTNTAPQSTPKVALITGITGQDGSYLAEFNYTEWRRTGLPDMGIEQIAAAANQFASELGEN